MAIINGTTGNDKLTGTGAADSINGGLGADTMTGLDGDDTYYVDNLGDTVVEKNNGGIDTVYSTVSIGALWDFVENAALTGSANLNVTGNVANNVLDGNSGSNIIDGGFGADKMYGGAGNDTYIVDNANDFVLESIAGAAGGVDTVKSSVDFTLDLNLENLTLTGNANINATGNNTNNVLTGNDGDNDLNGLAGADTMIGGKGNDTYHVESAGDKVIETLTTAQGGGIDTVVSSISFSLANLANVENLTLLNGPNGSTATGNALDNTITGDNNDNIINGAAGADTLIGWGGADTYYVDNLGDKVVEMAGEGFDTVISTVALTTAFANVENYTFQTAVGLNFTGNADNNIIKGGSGNDKISDGGGGQDQVFGNAGNDTLIGSADSDTLDGGAGDDIIDGGSAGPDLLIGGTGNDIITAGSGNDELDGGTGIDKMSGGDGNDVYHVDNIGDKVIENVNEGNFDTVYSSISIGKLFDNVEIAYLQGAGNLNLTGNDLGNALFGNNGNNILDGGAGADGLYGGRGNDTYYVDDPNDAAVEAAGEGTDLVISSVSHQLEDNVENLTLTGTAANGYGNALNNVIIGDDVGNSLDGGAGADIMYGGKGDDSYYVDNAGDKVIESVSNANGGGHDTVLSSVDFSIATQVNIDDIRLQGNGNINATGNASNNYISGTDGNNKLFGGAGNDIIDAYASAGNDIIDGGAGADIMNGGNGSTKYYIDNVGDQVNESGAIGTDGVYSSIALQHSISNIENYFFNTAVNLDFTGNGADNEIVGGSGNDKLNGGDGADVLDGGTGADTLIGGIGDDTYSIDNAKDIVIEQLNEGTDSVYSTVSIAKLWDNVENVRLGDAATALNAAGNDLDNSISGNQYNNILDGGKGADTLSGGKGNDTYYVDRVNDTVIENANEGVDTVISSVDYTLSANVENLTLTGFGTTGTGNALNNILIGSNNGDLLDGQAGADTMSGGKGDDNYFVDNIGDKVIETLNQFAGGGHDTVYSSVSFTLGANVEDVTLQGVADIDATGNALDNYLIGNNSANTLNGGLGADWMVGGKGDDTYYMDNINDHVLEKAGEGNDTIISTIALTNVIGNVENYTFNTATAVHFTGSIDDNIIHGGSGADVLDGGAGGNDKLYGGAGNDQLTTTTGSDALDGGTGADKMTGGDGDDTYYVDNIGDQVIENFNEGTDTVISSITIGKLFDNVEHGFLTGAANINITGNDLNNVLTGNDGANIIDGGLGNDVMAGGKGNDTYHVDSSNDTVSEFTGQGIDTVIASASFTLGLNVENLTLTGQALKGTGNDDNNVIIGDDQINTIDGQGGADTMIGGKGGDIYYVDNVNDKVVETLSQAAGGGVDLVYSSISYTLGANVEHLLLTGTADINATGNSLSNNLFGNSGNNILNGGLGADYMVGLDGNDTYYVDNLQDTINEGANGGTDTVISSIALTHGYMNVENYTFNTAVAVHFTADDGDNVIHGGNGADVIDGGNGWNQLYGGAGNDQLTGGSDFDVLDGGIGADKMAGGDGGDVYYVDNVGDIVTELLNNGNDSVFSSISIGKLYDNVENAQLLGVATLNLTGNDLDNYLSGNNAANKIDGGIGADYLNGHQGNDTLTGGSGADTFMFDLVQAVGNDGKDLVTDFTKGLDILQFNVGDVNHDNTVDLADLIASTKNIFDHGAGMAVDVMFNNGAQITFNGAGTGNVASIADLVSNSGTQIHLS